MSQSLDELYSTLSSVYKKDTDQDFPTNKIRFYMDFLWNALLEKPLTEEQKTSLKALIDLLNSLDDHKLSPTREMIASLSPQLTPLITAYPSLGHTFTFVATTLIPAYQRYLTSLEGLVKDAHAFTKEEVLLYYDMTLIDHAVLSHLFESEQSLNLVEVITSIKTVIIANALTHDYLQDALNRSISLFTFLQRGGLAKENCHAYYIELIDQLLASQKAVVTNESANAGVEYLCKKLVELASQQPVPPVPVTPDPTMVPTPGMQTPTEVVPTPVAPAQSEPPVSELTPMPPVSTQPQEMPADQNGVLP